MFTIESHTTLLGHRAHVVTTNQQAFARSLLEEARRVDLEPDFDDNHGAFTVGFICSDSDAQEAIEEAQLITSQSPENAVPALFCVGI